MLTLFCTLLTMLCIYLTEKASTKYSVPVMGFATKVSFLYIETLLFVQQIQLGKGNFIIIRMHNLCSCFTLARCCRLKFIFVLEVLVFRHRSIALVYRYYIYITTISFTFLFHQTTFTRILRQILCNNPTEWLHYRYISFHMFVFWLYLHFNSLWYSVLLRAPQ